MFPYRGLLALIIIGFGYLVIQTGITSIPAPASLVTLVQESSITLPDMPLPSSTLSVSELRAALESNPKALVIDVRSAEEWAEAHIDHPRVISLGLGEVIRDPSQLDTSRDMYLLCQSGNRSSMAQMILSARGVETTNVSGGMNAWIAAGYPVVSE